MSKPSIEELVKRKIDEIWNEEKIEDVVRHELEERVQKVLYKTDDWIREYLATIIVKIFKKEKLEKLVDEQLTAEKVIERINSLLKDWSIENLVKEKLRGVINEIPVEILNEQMVKNAIEEAREIARSYTRQTLMDILKGYCDMELRYLLNSIEELRTVSADLVKRVSRLEEKVRTQ
jgi:hypothetical protein